MNKNEILEKYNLEMYINTELSQNYKDLESIQRYIEKMEKKIWIYFLKCFGLIKVIVSVI
ncbi:hypothetical protein [Clostridium beijerinckii]|jgi:hypothetical protein|uniref:hypothetical protein n=1 Tax=Clostridium beijerinckii TaxID=1520 RepID=UPI001494FCBF|nr:hypothetical protein [Clostridium beijerinckii]MBC2459088.1 hypothetical protein [Clostridium beijerinckii]MCI1585230.1 hypothetical protein [Clostridium beijerinckii]MCI1625031.1 hypothetical protein [Clostridium beijerinckii]NOV59542.1 hypothetical protein [Clostridium beijerinckii]NOV72696.1 hypothetical protein [Clostridium beijerinckii]